MSPETRAFLDDVRHAEDPTQEDERRVLEAVRATVAAGVVAGGAAGLFKYLKVVTGSGLVGSKTGSILLCLVVATTLVDSAPPGAASTVAPRSPTAELEGRPRDVPRAASAAPANEAPEERRPIAPASAAPRRSPARESVRHSARTGASGAASLVASAMRRPESLRDELALLVEVQAAIERGDGETALKKLAEHETSDKRLLAEREAARILALCAAGRAADARRSAIDFARRHPASVHAERIARSCANAESSDRR